MPVSFSRAIEIAVISAETIVSTKATQPGHEEVGALQRRVVAHARLRLDPEPRCAPATASRYQRSTMARGIPHHDAAGVGIAPVGEELERQRVAPAQPALDLVGQHQRLADGAAPERGLERRGAGQHLDDGEPVRGGDPLPQLEGGHVRRRVHDGDGDVAHVGAHARSRRSAPAPPGTGSGSPASGDRAGGAASPSARSRRKRPHAASARARPGEPEKTSSIVSRPHCALELGRGAHRRDAPRPP